MEPVTVIVREWHVDFDVIHNGKKFTGVFHRGEKHLQCKNESTGIVGMFPDISTKELAKDRFKEFVVFN